MKVLAPLGTFQIILVDDRSPDDSWAVIKQLSTTNASITGIRLSRNFGQHYAITAGLRAAVGEWVVVMDADLQDPPEAIPSLLEKAREGYDIVLARRQRRTHNVFKVAGSKLFYRIFALLSGYRLDPTVGAFRVMKRTVVESFNSMNETYRLFGAMIHWLGFKVGYHDVDQGKRFEGKSSYNLSKMLGLALDGIISFSNRPLYFATGFGALMAVAAGFYGIYLLLHHFFIGQFAVSGWLSTIVLTTFIGGLVLLNLGIIGIYIGRIYDQTKGRPLFVIDEVIGGKYSDSAVAKNSIGA